MINEINDRDIANEFHPDKISQMNPEQANFGVPESDYCRPFTPKSDLKSLAWIAGVSIVVIWFLRSLLGL